MVMNNLKDQEVSSQSLNIRLRVTNAWKTVPVRDREPAYIERCAGVGSPDRHRVSARFQRASRTHFGKQYKKMALIKTD
jgi:hypothetical protein